MDVMNFLSLNGCSTGTSRVEDLVNNQIDCISATYWSSTENSQNNAWNVNFSDGNTNNNNKYNSNYVRAVAALDEEIKIGWIEAFDNCCAKRNLHRNAMIIVLIMNLIYGCL